MKTAERMALAIRERKIGEKCQLRVAKIKATIELLSKQNAEVLPLPKIPPFFYHPPLTFPLPHR